MPNNIKLKLDKISFQLDDILEKEKKEEILNELWIRSSPIILKQSKVDFVEWYKKEAEENKN